MQDHESITGQLHTLRDYIRWTVAEFNRSNIFFGHGTDNALDEALRLVLYFAGVELGEQADFLDARLTLAESEQVLDAIEQRINKRLPLPYITGQAWFAGLAFNVDRRVLIPRSPIAELIEQGFSPWLIEQPVERILDLCTGGGCIGITCAHYFEYAEVDLGDISSDALVVANSNIALHQLQGRVKAVQSDLFHAFESCQYQLIVCNPPYVDSEDLASMPEEYQHEPALALGSGNDGLNITRKVLAQAANFLSDDGLLVVEVGNSGLALEKAYPEVPFTWVEFERGGHGVFVFNKQELLYYAEHFA